MAIDSGRRIDLVTNDLDAPAEEIAALYKQRWQIELFFKWIKQNLKIKHFLGVSENAVKIQIYVALIAFLILRAAHGAQTAIPRPQAFARLVRLNIMHRRSLPQHQGPAANPAIGPKTDEPETQPMLNRTPVDLFRVSTFFCLVTTRQLVDGRDKPGHDERRMLVVFIFTSRTRH